MVGKEALIPAVANLDKSGGVLGPGVFRGTEGLIPPDIQAVIPNRILAMTIAIPLEEYTVVTNCDGHG